MEAPEGIDSLSMGSEGYLTMDLTDLGVTAKIQEITVKVGLVPGREFLKKKTEQATAKRARSSGTSAPRSDDKRSRNEDIPLTGSRAGVPIPPKLQGPRRSKAPLTEKTGKEELVHRAAKGKAKSGAGKQKNATQPPVKQAPPFIFEDQSGKILKKFVCYPLSRGCKSVLC